MGLTTESYTGWAKKVIPLVHYITLYERYHFFGPPCSVMFCYYILCFCVLLVSFKLLCLF